MQSDWELRFKNKNFIFIFSLIWHFSFLIYNFHINALTKIHPSATTLHTATSRIFQSATAVRFLFVIPHEHHRLCSWLRILLEVPLPYLQKRRRHLLYPLLFRPSHCWHTHHLPRNRCGADEPNQSPLHLPQNQQGL